MRLIERGIRSGHSQPRPWTYPSWTRKRRSAVEPMLWAAAILTMFLLMLSCVGCTSVITTMTDPDGNTVSVRERRILMAASSKDNSVLREKDGSFIVGLKSTGESGDTAMVNAIATGIIAGMKAGALAAATSGAAP